MPGVKKSKKAVSQAQAGYLGAVAGGKIQKKGLSKEKAKEKLRGVKVSKLPKKK